jgi:16S rRNA (uracil1498-N3)-methyltransferase
VIPIVTARTERASFRPARAEQVLRAAMKQCLRSRCVAVDEVTSFSDALACSAGEQVFVCHESAASDSSLLRVLAEGPARPALTILVGPEGGFTDAEVAEAKDAGAQVVSLGARRLRAETAAIAVCAGAMLYFGG